MRGTLAERLATKQWRDPVTGCLLFTGFCNPKGYGMIGGENGQVHPTHRVAAFLAGIIPSLDDPHMVCHHCDTPPCTEPDHLYKGDVFTNSADAVSRGRLRPLRGSAQVCAKLTEEEAIDIRQADLPQRLLASIYGVSQRAIWNIKNGTNWTHAV